MLEAMLGMSSSGATGEWVEQSKLVASDGAADDRFGSSVAISGDGNTVVIYSYYTNGRGKVYFFNKENNIWIEHSFILASDGAASDQFGISLSLSVNGTTVIIGARGDDSNKGSAYIFIRSGSTWTQQAKLVASDGAAFDQFGFSVAISGDGTTVVVGAYQDDDKGNDSGSAYIFVYNGSTWIQQRKLTASDGAATDNFGFSVAISGDGNTAIVGSPYDDDLGSNSGSAYIFIRSGTTWPQQAKLLASDGAASDRFGYSVAISADGNSTIVGAYTDDTGRGSAYIYSRSGSTWSQQAKLVASDGAANDYFSISVAISADGSTAIVGAFADDSYKGSAYVFTRSGSTWTQQVKLVASDGAASDYFGRSVSISGDGSTAIIGAYYDDSVKGSAYIFIN